MMIIFFSILINLKKSLLIIHAYCRSFDFIKLNSVNDYILSFFLLFIFFLGRGGQRKN